MGGGEDALAVKDVACPFDSRRRVIESFPRVDGFDRSHFLPPQACPFYGAELGRNLVPVRWRVRDFVGLQLASWFHLRKAKGFRDCADTDDLEWSAIPLADHAFHLFRERRDFAVRDGLYVFHSDPKVVHGVHQAQHEPCPASVGRVATWEIPKLRCDQVGFQGIVDFTGPGIALPDPVHCVGCFDRCHLLPPQACPT